MQQTDMDDGRRLVQPMAKAEKWRRADGLCERIQYTEHSILADTNHSHQRFRRGKRLNSPGGLAGVRRLSDTEPLSTSQAVCVELGVASSCSVGGSSRSMSIVPLYRLHHTYIYMKQGGSLPTIHLDTLHAAQPDAGLAHHITSRTAAATSTRQSNRPTRLANRSKI